MTCLEFIETFLRPRISDPDTGYSNDELMHVLTASLLQIYSNAAASGKGTFVKSHTATNYGRIPKDFGGFAGQQPIRQEDGRFHILTGESSLQVRYHPTVAPDLVLSSDLPLPGRFLPLLLDIAAVRALNRHEFDTSQDQAIGNALTDSMAGMMRHG